MKRPRGMIVEGWDLDDLPQGYCSDVEIDHGAAVRVSALLGPDGNPLLVPFERPALGFDLRPRK